MDKFRNLFPIPVEFSEGELPTASKMNGLSRQARRGLDMAEYALGDLWNQSGDTLLAAGGLDVNALMIPNLARYLGSVRHTSPRIPSLPDIEKYTHQVAVNDVGNHELVLSFPSVDPGSFTWSGTGAPSGSPQSTPGAVDSSGEWYLNRDTGYVYTYDAIVDDWRLEYEPVVDGDIGSDAAFNIIPDLDIYASSGFQSLKIEYVNGTDDTLGYYIYLPPRSPLDTRRVSRSPQDDVHTPTNTYNFQSNPSAGDRLFWQDQSTDADTSTNAEHYRYLLPNIITDNWGQGTSIPAGFLYLWDPVFTGTIIDGVLFAAENVPVPRKYLLVAGSGNLTAWLGRYGTSTYTTAMLQSTGTPGNHAPAHYPSNGLRLIIVGQDVSSLVSSLFGQFLDHDHSSSNSLPSQLVSHNQLTNTFYPDAVGSVPQLDPSTLDNDAHPQYLHRGGGNVSSRDKYNNAILGDLFIASTNLTSNYNNVLGNSNKVIFGSDVSGPWINYDINLGSGRLMFNAGSALDGFVMESANGIGCVLNYDFNASDIVIDATNCPLTLKSSTSAMYISAASFMNISAPTWVDIGSNGLFTLIHADGTGYAELTSGSGGTKVNSSAGDVDIEATTQDVNIDANDDISILAATGRVTIGSSADRVVVSADTTVGVYAENTIEISSASSDVDINADNDINIAAGNNINISAGGNIIVTDPISSTSGALFSSLVGASSFYTPSQSKNILCALTASLGSESNLGWYEVVANTWRCDNALASNHYVHCYLTDWPEGMTLTNVRVYWQGQSGVSAMTAAVYKISRSFTTNPLSGPPDTATTTLLGVTTSSTSSPEARDIAISTSAWSHASDILLITFLSGSPLATSYFIYPWVHLTVSFTSVNQWT